MLLMKNKRLLVERIKQPKEDGVIVYTDEQKHKSFEATIVATCDEYEYPVGTVVLFSEFAGEEIYYNAHKYIILDSENIWAEVKGEKA